MSKNVVRLGIVEDHVLLREALSGMLEQRSLQKEWRYRYQVVLQADNGRDMIGKLKEPLPQVLLVDVNMPEMDGYATTRWLKSNYPDIKVLVISMFSDSETILRILRQGAVGYLVKNASPDEIKEALHGVIEKAFYLSSEISDKIITGLFKESSEGAAALLTDREITFLRLVSTEKTYKEIAESMQVSARTVDGYREALFEKLKINSRVGLVIYAIRKGLVEIN